MRNRNVALGKTSLQHSMRTHPRATAARVHVHTTRNAQQRTNTPGRSRNFGRTLVNWNPHCPPSKGKDSSIGKVNTEPKPTAIPRYVLPCTFLLQLSFTQAVYHGPSFSGSSLPCQPSGVRFSTPTQKGRTKQGDYANKRASGRVGHGRDDALRQAAVRQKWARDTQDNTTPSKTGQNKPKVQQDSSLEP